MQNHDPMESFRSAVDTADRNPSKVVSYSWYLVLVSESAADVAMLLEGLRTTPHLALMGYAQSYVYLVRFVISAPQAVCLGHRAVRTIYTICL